MTNEPASEPRDDRPDEPEDSTTQDSMPEPGQAEPTAPVPADDASAEPSDDAEIPTQPAESAAAPTEPVDATAETPEPGVPPYEATGTATMPPPQAGGYASQFGLVRPLQGRYIAGVCAALGRATNTDPVLWRVLLPVLTVVHGFGGLIYLLGWLLIPAEGDSASPFEALIGRGRSSTSKAWTVVLSIVALAALVGGVTSGTGSRFLLFAAIIGGAVLLVTSRDPRSGWGPRSGVTPPWTAPPRTPNAAGASPWTTTTEIPDTPTYQAPFAPHGPFAPATTYTPTPTPTNPYPTAVIYPEPPVVGPPPAPIAPKPTRARRVILSCVVLAVGLLGALDAANVMSVPAPLYFAVALGTLGIGMIVAAFFGRVRGPVTLGVFLTIGLLVSSLVSGLHRIGDDNYYQPRTFAELHSSYSNSTGRTTLDLTKLDFGKNQTADVSVRLNVGLIRVILPPRVDATVTGQVDVGGTQIFGHKHGGIGNNPVTYTDTGVDREGGGTIILDATVNVGKVEVTR